MQPIGADDLQMAANAGCDAHMLKPADLPELLDMITSLCAKPDLKVIRFTPSFPG